MLQRSERRRPHGGDDPLGGLRAQAGEHGGPLPTRSVARPVAAEHPTETTT